MSSHADRQRNFDSFCRKLDRGGAAGAAVPAFWFDQDDATEPCCILTREQAHLMKAAKLGKFENHGRTFRLAQSAPEPVQFRFTPSESVDSAASISLAEMKANAGITKDEDGTPAPRHIVQRARQKVRAIGRRIEGSFDAKAPLAFGSRGIYPKEA
jgi:hypothetical protein